MASAVADSNSPKQRWRSSRWCTRLPFLSSSFLFSSRRPIPTPAATMTAERGKRVRSAPPTHSTGLFRLSRLTPTMLTPAPAASPTPLPASAAYLQGRERERER